MLRRYELTRDVKVYYGRIAGGEGTQAYIPDALDVTSVVRHVGTKPLR